MAARTAQPPRRTRARGPADAAAARLARSVDRTLQGYADRGVFRGFSTASGVHGTRRYQFLWLTRRPMALVLDPVRRRLVFDGLFPEASAYAGVIDAIRREVASAPSSDRPRHRRIDSRRAKMTCRFVRGRGSLQLAMAGADGECAVRAALGLINELFLVLHECFPEYLIAEFGASPE